jgi:hypothetical protein
MALRAAATLRVADHVARGVSTAPQMASLVQVDADALDRLLRHLVTLDLLSRDETGGYTLTSQGQPLRDDHPSGLRALLDVEGAIGRADLSFVHLLHSIRTGLAAFPVLFGRPFWEDLASEPGRNAAYDVQMGVDVAVWANAIVPAYDWGKLGHVIDVGGGNGTLIAALLRAYPTLRGTVLDQPATAEAARMTLAAAGVADRSDVVAGSFFDELPSGAGGYVHSAILHNWSDEAATTIFHRCAAAAGQGGRVFVIEKTGADGESPRTDMDLRVLAYMGGRERGVSELSSLAARADLDVVAAHVAGDLSILELTARRHA